jgi:uncharacterized membrane protein YdjX (TVP38/TMEM64 family)
MIRPDKKTILGLVALGVIIAVLLYLMFPLGLIRYFTDQRFLVHFITEHRAYAAFIFIGLQALQVVAAPVPGEVSGFVGGMLFGTVTGVFYSTLGLTLGSWLAFSIARVAGRPFVERVVNPDTIKRYDYIMKHKGLFLAFLLFLIPGFPKDYFCYLLGLGHMSQRDFLLVSTSGRLFGTVLLTVEGSLFRNKRYVAFFTVLGISILLILLTMIYREVIERWIRGLRAAQHLRRRTDRAKVKKRDNND